MQQARICLGIGIFLRFYFDSSELFKWQKKSMILLFTSAITSEFAECRHELERLKKTRVINEFNLRIHQEKKMKQQFPKLDSKCENTISKSYLNSNQYLEPRDLKPCSLPSVSFASPLFYPSSSLISWFPLSVL